MDGTLFFSAVMVLGGLTLVTALVLAAANARLQVVEDGRIDVVEEMLPHANCGACGFPGCRPFAEALVAAETTPAQCNVGSAEDHTRIAAYLGVDAGQARQLVARLACAGGVNVARAQAVYHGHGSCRAAALVAGGGKLCAWGCLGLGDCALACDFDALVLDAFQLPRVDEAKCTACNACVKVCPKDLFSLQPAEQRLWVACKSRAAGDEVLLGCEVGCTACARCVADAPEHTIVMRNNLPVIDLTVQHTHQPTRRCPTGAIVWMDAVKGPQRGEASPPITRTTPLPVGVSKAS